jgi:hypothetical protein
MIQDYSELLKSLDEISVEWSSIGVSFPGQTTPLEAATAIRALMSEINHFREIEDAAKDVVLAAWTDRFGRLHGHKTVVALEAVLQKIRTEKTK